MHEAHSNLKPGGTHSNVTAGSTCGIRCALMGHVVLSIPIYTGQDATLMCLLQCWH